MTTEQNHNDPRVSEAYHDLATERTPPELDRNVLLMAAAGTRSRYGLARAWVRPVAWAATIGLSLAFVLEMSQLRDVATPQVDADTVYQLEEVVIRDEAPAKAKDELRRLQKPVKRTDAPQAKPMSSPPAAAEPVAASTVAGAAAFAEKKEDVEHCDEDARMAVDTWYACILELRDSELAEAAEQELEALLMEFPTFRETDVNR